MNPIQLHISHTLIHVVSAMRVSQWIKNSFIILPLFFAKNVEPHLIVRLFVVTFLFCLLSSSVYIFNDLFDYDQDRGHPHKKNRPIASNKIKKQLAARIAATLAILSCAIGYYIDQNIGNFFSLYLAINILYSLFFKKIIFLDVVCIASGFVLRGLIGSIALETDSSLWMLYSIFFLSLFLALGKRKSELMTLGEGSILAPRSVLLKYSPRLLQFSLITAGVMAGGAFFLFSISDYAHQRFGSYNLIFSSPLAFMGIWRYFALLEKDGFGGCPTETLYYDKTLLFVIFLWLILISIIIN